METYFFGLLRKVAPLFPAYLQGMETRIVVSLPRLHGGFPAYLQGMETSVATFRPPPLPWVPSLPTRNGNVKLDPHLGAYVHVPSLPTRNGNAPRPGPGGAARASSQPTYKEWKPSLGSRWATTRRGSQPTYKEWKRYHSSTAIVGQSCSQPTYKEWKLLEGLHQAVCHRVPSLPTRNGNMSALMLSQSGVSGFPAYLQGMETGGNWPKKSCGSTFPAYLQGMETLSGKSLDLAP